ncbi:hypothetical protein T4A_1206 [Trichinella pseudospiralis]|nr:hypothetical protein T4A_1206 [Trichinella pseudospiralis]KRY89381.1 hypothetical protein T4D_15021 [Trichinella pseudospiralis]KRZ35973.1 hypothetical protein T4C_948 [Trichinella pseudospiralis]
MSGLVDQSGSSVWNRGTGAAVDQTPISSDYLASQFGEVDITTVMMWKLISGNNLALNLQTQSIHAHYGLKAGFIFLAYTVQNYDLKIKQGNSALCCFLFPIRGGKVACLLACVPFDAGELLKAQNAQLYQEPPYERA